MARPLDLTARTAAKVYFAAPLSPWQRPSDSNAKSPARQCLPKGTDLSGVSQAELSAIARLLSNRPRKLLGLRMPEEVYQEEIPKLTKTVALQT